MTNIASVRVPLCLPQDEFDALKQLADRRELSITHALRQAIQTELLVQCLVDQGAKLLVQPSDGELQQLVFTQAADAADLPLVQWGDR